MTDPQPNPLTTLCHFIINHFDADELRTLCFDLAIDFDDLAGTRKSSKVGDLLLHCGKHRKFDALLAALQRKRAGAFEETGLGEYDAEALYAALSVWDRSSEGAGGQAKYQVDAPSAQAGIIGNNAYVEGGIHFHTHASPSGKPLQRPPRAEHFTDRKPELAQLLDDLQPGRVVTLCGPGGIGKSALAAEAVWRFFSDDEPPQRFPDGIVFHNFYNQPEAALALEAIALAYGEEPRPSPAAAVQRALAGRRALLLDGTEKADDLGAVLRARGGCGVLVTSRKRKDPPSRRQRQDVRPLVIGEAVKLLQEFGGDLVDDQASAIEICKRVGGLPLAVRLVGQYLGEADEPASEYLEWLKETPIQALSHGKHREKSVDLLLKRSLDQVGEKARRALAVVGLLALAPFGVEPLAAALNVEDKETESADRVDELWSPAAGRPELPG